MVDRRLRRLKKSNRKVPFIFKNAAQPHRILTLNSKLLTLKYT